MSLLLAQLTCVVLAVLELHECLVNWVHDASMSQLMLACTLLSLASAVVLTFPNGDFYGGVVVYICCNGAFTLIFYWAIYYVLNHARDPDGVPASLLTGPIHSLLCGIIIVLIFQNSSYRYHNGTS